jgi:hypothetical protein
MDATNRRRRIGLALLAVILVSLIAWLVWPGQDEAGLLDRATPTFAPPEVLRVDAGPGELAGEPFTVEFDALGRLATLSVDAGVIAAPRSGRRLHHDVPFDLCDEPLPGELAAPPGTTVVEHDGVRVAYDASSGPTSLDRASLDRAGALALARETRDALDEAARWMDAPPRETLLVVSHPSREELNESLDAPGWAEGLYDGAVHLVSGDHEGSLRHEVMHAQLHAAAPCVPYWLDEGLAARFEHRPFRRAIQWLRMIHQHVWIPFASLAEPLTSDEGAELMARDEISLLYAQSLAMVSMLEDRGGEGAIARAVHAARDGMPRTMLFEVLMPDTGGEELLSYLSDRLFPSVRPEERTELRDRGYRCRLRDDGLPECVPLTASRATTGGRPRRPR